MGKGEYDNPESKQPAGPQGQMYNDTPPSYPTQNYPTQSNPPQNYNQQGYNNYPQNPSAIQMQPTNYAGVAPGTTVIVQQPVEQYSMVGHIIFSCVVFWCCNWLFGAIAFCVAMSGQNRPIEEARQKGKISMILNIVGIVITVILIVVVVALYFTGTLYYSSNRYYRVYG